MIMTRVTVAGNKRSIAAFHCTLFPGPSSAPQSATRRRLAAPELLHDLTWVLYGRKGSQAVVSAA